MSTTARDILEPFKLDWQFPDKQRAIARFRIPKQVTGRVEVRYEEEMIDGPLSLVPNAYYTITIQTPYSKGHLGDTYSTQLVARREAERLLLADYPDALPVE